MRLRVCGEPANRLGWNISMRTGRAWMTLRAKSNHAPAPRGELPCINVKNARTWFRKITNRATLMLRKVASQIATRHHASCVIDHKRLERLPAWTHARLTRVLHHGAAQIGSGLAE